MFVLESSKDGVSSGGGFFCSADANAELDAMCEKSWLTRTDAKYELEVY